MATSNSPLLQLCLTYNEKKASPTGGIEIDQVKNDKIGMVVALWARDEEISSLLLFYELGWTEPYIGTFKECIRTEIKSEYENYPPVTKMFTYRILKIASDENNHASLVGYLFGRTGFGISSKIKNLEFINKHLTGLGYPKIVTYLDFRKLLMPLPMLALAYLAIAGTFSGSFLGDYDDDGSIRDYAELFYSC